MGWLPEFLEKSSLCKLSTGSWKIYNYYDHMWSLLAVHDNIKIDAETKNNSKSKVDPILTLDRMTDESPRYGFAKETSFNKILKECEEDG